jgi:Putative MetA-pathway of phenol degradation
MKTIDGKLQNAVAASILFLLSNLPALAVSWTTPGATMGVPAGFVPPEGLYFVNATHWGSSAGNPSISAGSETPILIWTTGWTFLGANYAASAFWAGAEVGVEKQVYIRGMFNPYVNPITLSWNLGNGFFASYGFGVYLPTKSEITFSSSPGTATSGAAFENRLALSYLANNWIVSANTITGITTTDAAGFSTPDYFNLDLTFAHTFGKWELGAVGYGAWDLNLTPLGALHGGKGQELAIGGLVGYNFDVLDIYLEATHEIVNKGWSYFGKDDTRVWAIVTIPIWNPTPPSVPKTLAAKY